MEDLTGKTFGKWLVICKDENTGQYNSRGSRWICKCECGTIKSVRTKYLIKGTSKSCGCAKKVDYTGRKFGKLTVVETLYNYNGKKRAVCKCVCECGNTVYINANALRARKTCGCSKESVVGGAIKDLTGNKYGKLTVLEMLPHYKNNETYCRCICECGNKIITRSNGLKTGNTTSCGCIHSPSLIGKRFGKLTVIKETLSEISQRKWECLCDCGCRTVVTSYVLNSGHTTSCGCARSDKVSLSEKHIANYLKKQKNRLL